MTNDNVHSFDFNRLSCFYSSEYHYLIATGLYQGFELEQVKDIIHQLFLDFAEKKIDLHNVTNPKAYIITSFKRQLINAYRSSVKNGRASELYAEVPELSVDKVLEENEISAEKIKKLKEAYDLLPERCKKVIFLKYYEGLSNEAISMRTGLSMRSVYNNLSEGIRQLRSEIKEQNNAAAAVALSIDILLLLCLT